MNAAGATRQRANNLAKQIDTGGDGAIKKRRHRPQTLLLLLKSLMGLRVRVDLKNDAVIEGVVHEVVHDMEYAYIHNKKAFVVIDLIIILYSFTMVDAVETKPNVNE
jgi:hypothetical protein